MTLLPRRLPAAILLAALVFPPPIAHAGAPTAGGHVVRLETGLGLERVLVLVPPHPLATLVMLPGGTGRIGLRGDGRIRRGANFLVRTRDAWRRRGFAVLIPDAPDDRNLRGHRHGPAFAAVVAGLVRLAHRTVSSPVFLVGTSQGTIATINGAAHAPAGAIGGIVLTESVSVPGRLSRETVFDADPGEVRVPVLIVANHDDECPVAPPAMAPRIARALSASPAVTLRFVAGGRLRTRRCGSLGPHGYAGIEPRVETVISGWIDGRIFPSARP